MQELFDSRRVHYFLQVMASGSLRAAADQLEVEASAVSRAVSLLEKECGMTLLGKSYFSCKLVRHGSKSPCGAGARDHGLSATAQNSQVIDPIEVFMGNRINLHEKYDYLRKQRFTPCCTKPTKPSAP
ncbi:MAG: helix-turn-helix domain-containing protein [Polaromonas sp.]